jgi:hypothetical protein
VNLLKVKISKKERNKKLRIQQTWLQSKLSVQWKLLLKNVEICNKLYRLFDQHMIEPMILSVSGYEW